MKRNACVVSCVFVVLLSISPAIASNITLTLKQADIYGFRGDTVGWGFVISNNDPALDFQLSGFAFALPNQPQYADNYSGSVVTTPFDLGSPLDLFSQYLFMTIPAGSALDVPFDLVNNSGIYAITFDIALPPTTPGYPTDSGTFLVTGAWLDSTGAPLTAPVTLQADYSATVLEGQSAPVPEPASAVLLLSGLGILAARSRRRSSGPRL